MGQQDMVNVHYLVAQNNENLKEMLSPVNLKKKKSIFVMKNDLCTVFSIHNTCIIYL
jgi:hypothetical protein